MQANLLTLKDIATYLSISTKTVNSYIKASTFPKPDYLIGGHKRKYWQPSTIQSWLNKQTTQ